MRLAIMADCALLYKHVSCCILRMSCIWQLFFCSQRALICELSHPVHLMRGEGLDLLDVSDPDECMGDASDMKLRDWNPKIPE